MQQQQMDKLLTQIRSAKIETRKTDQLLPYARNARKHEDWQVAQIAASIKEFGFTNPVLIDETGEIVAGHGRVMAALKLSLEEVPCIVLSHMTPIQRKAYVIADNQLALNSTWDVGILGNELDELKLDGFDIDLLGFGDDELNAILDGANSVEGTEGLTDPDEVPEVEKPIVSRGEVWVLGNHRLMCGDSTAITDVEKLMAGEKADMVFTDPPYGVSFVGLKGTMYVNGKRVGRNSSDEIVNDDLRESELSQLFFDSISIAATYSKDNAAHYIFFAINRSRETLEAIEKCGLHIRNWLIWDKGNVGFHAMGAQYKPNYEAFLYLIKNSPVWCGDNSQQTIWRHSTERLGLHPTMKPVSLIEQAIRNHNPTSILDVFLGSGSTLIACEKTKRKCYGMEIDPHYCTVILKRWAQFTGKEPQRLEEDGSLTQMSEIN